MTRTRHLQRGEFVKYSEPLSHHDGREGVVIGVRHHQGRLRIDVRWTDARGGTYTALPQNLERIAASQSAE